MERNQATSGATDTLFRIGLVLGLGQVGTLDEVVFHQLLQWHNFYVHTTEYWRIVSDGLFHTFSSAMLLLGALLLWQHRRKLSTLRDARPLFAGALISMGGFNLYDGIIQHKVLGLHPVREGVEHILPYDLAWNGAALLLLTAGWLLWRRVRRDGVA